MLEGTGDSDKESDTAWTRPVAYPHVRYCNRHQHLPWTGESPFKTLPRHQKSGNVHLSEGSQ